LLLQVAMFIYYLKRMINYYIFTGFLIAVSKMLVIRHLVFLVAVIQTLNLQRWDIK